MVLIPIGRMAFPLFAFLLTEGFVHSKHRQRYFLSLAAFALVSELPFDICFFGLLSSWEGTSPFYWGYQNVFFTLLLGLAAMWCIEKLRCNTDVKPDKIKSILLQCLCVAALAGVAELIHSDYGAIGVLLIAAFYVTRSNRIYQVLAFLAVQIFGFQKIVTVSVWYLLVCLIILLYNGKRGSLRINKYAFYAFYPIHMIVLIAASKLVSAFA